MVVFMLDNGREKADEFFRMLFSCFILIRKHNTVMSFDNSPDILKRKTTFKLDTLFYFCLPLRFGSFFTLLCLLCFIRFKKTFNFRIDKRQKGRFRRLPDEKNL